jgi:hypothetical protein
VRRYEENSPAIATEMTPLKAVVDPMFTRASRQAMKLVNMTAYTGIDVLSLTLLSVRHPGSPLSLANAQQIRDVDAENPTFALMVSTMTIDAITAAPDRDCTARWKIAMKGNAGFSSRTASRSPIRKRTVSIMPKPSVPFIAIPVMIERGTTICALWISSESWCLLVSTLILLYREREQ